MDQDGLGGGGAGVSSDDGDGSAGGDVGVPEGPWLLFGIFLSMEI